MSGQTFFYSSLFILTLFAFIKVYFYFLSLLLVMEFLALLVFSSLSLYFSSFMFDTFYVLYFLSVAVCEAALGLSLLVSYVRSKGSDLLALKT